MSPKSMGIFCMLYAIKFYRLFLHVIQKGFAKILNFSFLSGDD